MATHHVRQKVLEDLLTIMDQLGTPVVTTEVENFDELEPEDLPAVIVRQEREDVITGSSRLGDLIDRKGPDSEQLFGNDENGGLVLKPGKMGTDPLCYDQYNSDQFYSIEIIVQAKKDASALANRIFFMVMSAIAKAPSLGLLRYDGMVPERPSESRTHYGLIMQYRESAHFNPKDPSEKYETQ
jgi:hypothetical protein